MRTCYDCAEPVAEDVLVCPACGGVHMTYGRARLTSTPSSEGGTGPTLELPHPWAPVLGKVSSGAVVGVFGPPGSGKTALAATLGPGLWLSSEQTASQAGASIRWACGGDPSVGEILEVSDVDRVRSVLRNHLGAGLVVLDSVTRIGSLAAQRDALVAVEGWARRAVGRYALVILQVNAKGEPAGLTENEHLTTAVVGVSGDGGGRRRLAARKNREGPLGAAYFALTARGVETPEWPYSYSVEGGPGRYKLHPYPLGGAKWAGLLADRYGKGEIEPGVASAGVVAFGYPSNRLEPDDVAARRAFAEAHGLTWLDHTPRRPDA